jgi:hypothetical protein
MSVDDPQTRTRYGPPPVRPGRPLATGPEHPVLARASVGHALCLVVRPSRTGRSEPTCQLNGTAGSECRVGVRRLCEHARHCSCSHSSVITVNRRHCPPAPRLTAASTRRTGVRRGAKRERSGAGRAERGAIVAPCRALIPASYAQGRHHGRDSRRARSRRSSWPTVLPTQPEERPSQRMARPDQDDRLHQRQESPAKPRRRGANRACTLTRGKCHR